MAEAEADILTAEILPDSAPRMTTATTDQPTITMTKAEAEILPVGHGITNDDSDEDVDFSEERQILCDREKLLMLSSDAAAEAGGDGDHSAVADLNNYNPNPDPFDHSEMIDEGMNEKEAEGGDNSIVTSDNSYNPIHRRICVETRHQRTIREDQNATRLLPLTHPLVSVLHEARACEECTYWFWKQEVIRNQRAAEACRGTIILGGRV